MEIISKIVSKFAANRLEEIDYFKKNPDEVQTDCFNRLIEAGKQTQFGKEHRFSDLKSLNAYGRFKQNVPIRRYEEFKPYIDRVIAGEKKLLWNSEIRWFAKSSGTTGSASKFIPISKESLEECHFRGGKDIIAVYSRLQPVNKMLAGRALAVGGSQQINSFENNSFYGDLSAVLIENLPFWANILRTPDKATALLPEWEEKIEKMADKTSKVNVTNISGVPSWTLILLKKILSLTGNKNLHEVWPNLELFVHGGVSFTPYRTEYEKIIPSPKMNYLETYNASEGFFGIQDDFEDASMLLMLDYGVFYEFVAFEDFDKEQPDTVPLEDIELNKNYAAVITTNGGLWRYMIGDTLKFTSKKPYKFVITGRTKHFINAFGEELIIDNAEKALDEACKKTKAVISEYTAAPIYMSEKNTGGHEWIIEFSTRPDDFELFAKTLDDNLKAVNTDYAAKRHKNMTLRFPKIHNARKGLFYDWMKKRGKVGGQNKVPRLTNHREYVEALLAFDK